jgi:hypothetical protein
LASFFVTMAHVFVAAADWRMACQNKFRDPGESWEQFSQNTCKSITLKS